LAESDPRDSPRSPGPARTSISTKDQPSIPILRQFRGTQKILPDWPQVPSRERRGHLPARTGDCEKNILDNDTSLGGFRPQEGTPGLLIYDVLTDRRSSILGGLGGPGRPGSLPKRWGVSPPSFLEGIPAARGRLDPKKSTISGRSKNHILKTQV